MIHYTNDKFYTSHVGNPPCMMTLVLGRSMCHPIMQGGLLYLGVNNGR